MSLRSASTHTAVASSSSSSAASTRPTLTAAGLFGNDRFYVSSSAVARMPSFPEAEWNKKPLDPGGTMDPAGQDRHVPYNVDWLEQWRVRQMFAETDLLYQFVTRVAARTGKRSDLYFRGGATASDALEALMVNVVTNSLHQQVLADDKLLHMRDGPINVAALDDLRRSAQQFVRGAAHGMVQAGAAELQRAELPEQMSEAATRAQEELWRAAVQSFQQRGSESRIPTAAPAAVAPGRTVFTKHQPRPMQHPDDMLQPPPVYDEYAPLTPAQLEARQRAMEPPAAHAAEGLRDPRVMLTYLLLRGNISKTEIDTVDKIYGPPQLVLRDRERIKQMLDDAQKLERMLRAKPALDWMEAPQHTGFLFFEPTFTAAVDSAVRDVHHVCNKRWALEIDLMTHEEVSTDFGELVAFHLLRAVDQRLSRFGSGKETVSERERMHLSLIRKFRKLGQVYREHPVPGMFLTFAGLDGHQLREATEEERRQFMEKRHRYYSDRHQERPPVQGAAPAAANERSEQRRDRTYSAPPHL